MNASKKEQEVEELLTRSVSHTLPSKEELKKALLSGKRLHVYMGVDATGKDLHIGHATNFILLEKLRAFGHKVTILFGDFTALIGDPTDKKAARKKLTEKEVKENIKTWKEQVGKIINLNDKKNKAVIVRNSEWLKKINLKEVIELCSHFTIQQLLERDMFQERIRAQKPIFLNEFLYPLLQGYDSVHMDVDIEIGGTDQTFNMLVGRTLARLYNNKEKHIIATTLLENKKTGGKLMSKSEGNYIALNDSGEEMFGKTMALPDEVIIQVFRDCTRVSVEEIAKYEKKLEEGANPRDIKQILARELVKTFHGGSEATRAEDKFTRAFQKNAFPSDAQELKPQKGEFLKDILVSAGIVVSKNEYKRLLQGKAIHDVDNKKTIAEDSHKIEGNVNLRIGKRRFIKITVT